MLGLSNPTHILLVLLVILLVFGAKRLPEMGRSLGAGLRGFKESINGEPSQPSVEQLPAAPAAAPEPVAEIAPDATAAPFTR
jgi:sec-independent protein translocase protein TatA